MCVIAVCEQTRPTDEQIDQFSRSNPTGAGIAWRETDSVTGEVWVRWVKGMPDRFPLVELKKLVREVPFPFVVHCRIPSVGGPAAELCHPFPLDQTAAAPFEGRTQKGVLFHNGTYSAWEAQVWDMAVKGRHTIPDVRWSDSRAMAWIASHLGAGVLKFFKEKIIVLTPSEVGCFAPGPLEYSWHAIAEGLWTSNLGWQNTSWTKEYDMTEWYEREYPGAHTHGWGPQSRVMGPVEPKALTTLKKGDAEVSPDQHPFCDSPEGVCRQLAKGFKECPQTCEGAVRSGPEEDPEEAEPGDTSGARVALATDDDLKALGEAYVWAQGLNGKSHKGIMNPAAVEAFDGKSERSRRRAAAARGVTHLGRL